MLLSIPTFAPYVAPEGSEGNKKDVKVFSIEISSLRAFSLHLWRFSWIQKIRKKYSAFFTYRVFERGKSERFCYIWKSIAFPLPSHFITMWDAPYHIQNSEYIFSIMISFRSEMKKESLTVLFNFRDNSTRIEIAERLYMQINFLLGLLHLIFEKLWNIFFCIQHKISVKSWKAYCT